MITYCKLQTFQIKVILISLAVPPDILDYPTSTDMVVDEGSNVSLQCIAKGSPQPFITWKREDGEMIRLQNGSEGTTISL